MDLIEIISKRTKAKGLTYKSVAETTRIHPSFFSRVMQRKASFSKDQVFLISRALDCDSKVTEYWLLLSEKEVSGNRLHRDFLDRKIKKIKRELASVSGNEELSEDDKILFFSNIIVQKIHLALTIDRYAQNFDLLAMDLGISKSEFENAFSILIDLRLVKKKENQWEVKIPNWNLHSGSEASMVNHLSWRIESAKKCRSKKEEDFQFTAVFSSSLKLKEEIADSFREWVNGIHKKVSSEKKGEKVLTMTFDLFE